MQRPLIYLDANASEVLRPQARQALIEALDGIGNPSSVHASGRRARAVLEQARQVVADHLGEPPARVVFTSGGTEANAAAIRALGRGRRLLVSTIEHDAVRAAAGGASHVGVGSDGVVRLDELARLLDGGPPSLVCLMLANNETGVIQPVTEAASLCRAHGARLHVDAVQAAGRLPLRLAALGADSLAISAHKLGGPAGIGAWVMAADASPDPLIAGGGQERGWRGGTPSVALAAGFAAALAAATESWDGAQMAALRDEAEAAAMAAGAAVIGAGAPRLANTTCLRLPGVPAQTQVMALDLEGIAVSAGAACSSGKVARSHVLDAMGLAEGAGEAIRVSLPWNATAADVAAFAAAYARVAARLLARRAA